MKFLSSMVFSILTRLSELSTSSDENNDITSAFVTYFQFNFRWSWL